MRERKREGQLVMKGEMKSGRDKERGRETQGGGGDVEKKMEAGRMKENESKKWRDKDGEGREKREERTS